MGSPIHSVCGLEPGAVVSNSRESLLIVGCPNQGSLTLLSLQVDAHRRQSLARLPMVLVLHLKRFQFDKTGGSQKILKQVTFKMDLEVGRGEL